MISPLSVASAILTPTVTPSTGGMIYEYAVTNQGPETIFDIVIYTSGLIVPGSVTSPSGWDATASSNTVEWFASDTFAFVPMSTLSGFTYLSLANPSVATFTTIGLTPGGDVVVTASDTIGPEAQVPEPSTVVLIAFPLCVCCVSLKICSTKQKPNN